MTSALNSMVKPLVAMVHLPPLPGASNYQGEAMSAIVARAVGEARLLEASGFDAIMLQNTHDRPSREVVPRLTVAAMTAVAAAVKDVIGSPLGINLHKNDAEGALAVAGACQAAFVRIKVLVGAVVGPEGVIQGAAETAIRVRAELPSPVEVWADLNELTSRPLTPIPMPDLADLAQRFGMADRLLITCPTIDESLAAVGQARKGTTLPILLGGRTTAGSIARVLASCDGAIVGTCLRRGGNTTEPLDETSTRGFIAAARGEVKASRSLG